MRQHHFETVHYLQNLKYPVGNWVSQFACLNKQSRKSLIFYSCMSGKQPHNYIFYCIMHAAFPFRSCAGLLCRSIYDSQSFMLWSKEEECSKCNKDAKSIDSSSFIMIVCQLLWSVLPRQVWWELTGQGAIGRFHFTDNHNYGAIYIVYQTLSSKNALKCYKCIF